VIEYGKKPTLSNLANLLQRNRILLILDSLDAVLDLNGTGYIEGYELYGDLVQMAGEGRHKSCVILTSRQQPHEVRMMEGLAVKTLRISDLELPAANELLRAKGVEEGILDIWECYGGNPTVLMQLARPVIEMFGGDGKQFVAARWIPLSVCNTLQRQLQHLSHSELKLLIGLALNDEGLTIQEIGRLYSFLVFEICSTLDLLHQQALIEVVNGRYVVPQVMRVWIQNEMAAWKGQKQGGSHLLPKVFPFLPPSVQIKGQKLDHRTIAS
jgi:hypothetical protein